MYQGYKVFGRSHAFHAFLKGQLAKESPAFQKIVTDKPDGNMAMMFKHSCMNLWRQSKKAKLNEPTNPA